MTSRCAGKLQRESGWEGGGGGDLLSTGCMRDAQEAKSCDDKYMHLPAGEIHLTAHLSAPCRDPDEAMRERRIFVTGYRTT